MPERFTFNDDEEDILELDDTYKEDIKKDGRVRQRPKTKTKKVTKKKTKKKTKVKKQKEGRSIISTVFLFLLSLIIIAAICIGGYFAYDYYIDQEKKIDDLQQQIDNQQEDNKDTPSTPKPDTPKDEDTTPPSNNQLEEEIPSEEPEIPTDNEDTIPELPIL